MGDLEQRVNIAIDGLPASGKDTITQILYYVLNNIPLGNIPVWKVIDSSAMYRAISLFLEEYHESLGIPSLSKMEKNKGNGAQEFEQMVKTVNLIRLEVDFLNKVTVYYNDGEVCAEYNYSRIKQEDVSVLAGYIATISEVRPHIIDMERNIAKNGYCLVSGRDGFSVVLKGKEMPYAIGIYPYADVEIRAKRRTRERYGEDDSEYSRILEEMMRRDLRDKERTGAALPVTSEAAKREGYLCIDTGNMSIIKMGIRACRLVFESLDIQIPSESLTNLVQEACRHYNLS